MRIAGIMSGTSLDGIDVAVIDIAGRRIKTVGHFTTPYSTSVRARILAVSNVSCATGDISRLNFELGELYAKAVFRTCRKRGIPLESLDLIGCHGQTIFHERGNTLQIGEASVLAERLGIPVISDFRTRDIAAGGRGAPLVPFMDRMLFGHPTRDRVALNIGGIANITVLPRKSNPESVVAFDTGPGNMVIDQLVERHTGGRARFDRNGAIASKGHVNRELLNSLTADSYFKSAPPKTAGREQYGKQFVDRLIGTRLSEEDLIATATAFTAASIAMGIRRFAPATTEIIAAGGGIHNSQLMAQIAAFLPNSSLTTTADFGIDPDAKEAIAFAVLAHASWKRKPGNLPSATGARQPVVLGKLTF